MHSSRNGIWHYSTFTRRILPHTHTTQTSNPVNYATHLKSMMRKLQPPSIQRHQQRNSHVHQDLRTCLYVFMRNDTVKKPLQPPYDGPFQVLQRNDKHFTLDITGKKKVISLDRLKPAFMDNSLPSTNDGPATKDSTSTDASSSTQDQPLTPAASSSPSTLKSTTRVTRAGRHVHWPRKLAEYRSLP